MPHTPGSTPQATNLWRPAWLRLSRGTLSSQGPDTYLRGHFNDGLDSLMIPELSVRSKIQAIMTTFGV